MRIVRVEAGHGRFYAELKGDRLLQLDGMPYAGQVYTGKEYLLEDVTLLAPCEPSKLVCVGKNYYEHALEMQEGQPEEPLLFLKPNTCVIPNNGIIEYPSISARVDYEGELAVVIGKRARHVLPGQSAQFIFGYTCANDVTARDIQKGDPQWTRGKGFDTFAPLGPWVETELDPADIKVCTRLNGQQKQCSSTALMTHGVDKLICYITQCMTLLPGDVVLTGTPAGIGPMQRGDVVEVEIEGIGTLVNKVV